MRFGWRAMVLALGFCVPGCGSDSGTTDWGSNPKKQGCWCIDIPNSLTPRGCWGTAAPADPGPSGDGVKVPELCGWCHGSGQSQIDPELICPRCHGAGVTTGNP